MGLWYPVERDASGHGEIKSGVPRARTHVLLIGTSFYEGLPPISPVPPVPSDDNIFGLTQVESPATSAFDLANWFRKRYHNPSAPLGNIWLLLSPSDGEKFVNPALTVAANKVGRAVTRNVEDDLKAWKAACGANPDNVAILYASGHGIALTQTDSFVLLDDFAEQLQPLKGSLDIGRIKNGMIGSGMAQTQVYFADACRLQPEGVTDWAELGAGLGVLGKPSGPDRRSIALYYSATAYEAALARRRKGTLFVEALLDCLNGMAWAKPDDTSPNWHVSMDSLTSKLNRRVNALSGGRQSVTMFGQETYVTLHVVDPPPTVDLRITCSPTPDVARTWINLRTGNGKSFVKNRAVFTSHPFEIIGLNPGLYTMDVGFDPPVTEPFEDRGPMIIDAFRPPLAFYPVEFP